MAYSVIGNTVIGKGDGEFPEHVVCYKFLPEDTHVVHQWAKEHASWYRLEGNRNSSLYQLLYVRKPYDSTPPPFRYVVCPVNGEPTIVRIYNIGNGC